MLGSGGMGSVYRATDPSLDRYVAIKVLTHREPKYIERFRREAQVLAKIMHPSIIQIYEIVGTDEDQQDPYIVMEYFEGKPLDSALKMGPLKAAAVVNILRQTAEGLKKAHGNHVIHPRIGVCLEKTCGHGQRPAAGLFCAAQRGLHHPEIPAAADAKSTQCEFPAQAPR